MTLRIGVVGTGGVATRHLGVLRQLGSTVVVGHVSADQDRAKAQAERWGGRAYALVNTLLDDAHPDAVWVCVAPDRHGAIEAALIERGLPFFVEKPLAADLPTAERIGAQLAERPTPLPVGVGYKLRALDTLPTVRQLLAETPPRMVLGAWHDQTPSPPWWRRQSRSGGQMVEQATHLVDLARVLVGEAIVLAATAVPATLHPRAAFPDADIADVSAALLQFEGAVPGVFTATCLLRGKQAAHLQIIREGRSIVVSEAWTRIETGQEFEEIASSADPFLVEDEAFLEAVRTGDARRVLCDYDDALRTHRLCTTIARMGLESAARPILSAGRWSGIPPATRATAVPALEPDRERRGGDPARHP